MYVLDLPYEVLGVIFEHVFTKWTATMDLTCQLSAIPNIRILRACRMFHDIGSCKLKSAFSGEFIREDSRGCIKDPNLQPRTWYTWIIQNCKTLVINDAYYTSV